MTSSLGPLIESLTTAKHSQARSSAISNLLTYIDDDIEDASSSETGSGGGEVMLNLGKKLAEACAKTINKGNMMDEVGDYRARRKGDSMRVEKQTHNPSHPHLPPHTHSK
jgi:hypothetical protein